MRWRAFGGVLAAAALSLAVFASSAAAKLVADYRFDGDVSSSVPGAPALTNIGAGNAFGVDAPAGCPRGVLEFPEGNGVSLGTTGLVPQHSYTVIVLFRLTEVGAPEGSFGESSYRRILNFNGTSLDESDHGFYVLDGKLNFYDGFDHEGTASVAPDQFVEVAFTRDLSKRVNVYANGALDVSVDDVEDVARLDDAALAFFVDNGSTEMSAGAVARIRVYDTALQAAQITNTVGCIAPERCGGKAVTIPGDAGSNMIIGTPRADVIAGGGAKDVIRGLGGSDTLCGNGGRDRLIGGRGRDRLLGGAGRDRLLGAKGRDLCRGGAGRDVRRGCERGRG